MVDCAKTEHQAIRSAFPHASVYLCLFHVAQIWEKKIQKDASVRFQGPSIKSTLRRAKTEEDLLLQWDAFKRTFPTATTINNFLEKNWINKERMPEWAPLYRSVSTRDQSSKSF